MTYFNTDKHGQLRLNAERNASAGRFDVVAYRDADATQVAARWPWYYSRKPRRNQRRVTLNCYYWKAVWL